MLYIYIYMCVRNYYIVILHNDYTFPSTRYAHIIAKFATHLVHVLQNKEEIRKYFNKQYQETYTYKNIIFSKTCQNPFALILTSSGGTPVILLRILLLLLNPRFCLLLSFKKTSSKVSNRCISISFDGDSSARNLPFLIKPMIPACLK